MRYKTAVTDQRGRPRKVFHGTKAIFDEFSSEHGSQVTIAGVKGHCFSESPETAAFFTGETSTVRSFKDESHYQEYLENNPDALVQFVNDSRIEVLDVSEGGNVHAVYLDIQNPVSLNSYDDNLGSKIKELKNEQDLDAVTAYNDARANRALKRTDDAQRTQELQAYLAREADYPEEPTNGELLWALNGHYYSQAENDPSLLAETKASGNRAMSSIDQLTDDEAQREAFAQQQAQNFLKENGYDGLSNSPGTSPQVWVAFDDEQICRDISHLQPDLDPIKPDRELTSNDLNDMIHVEKPDLPDLSTAEVHERDNRSIKMQTWLKKRQREIEREQKRQHDNPDRSIDI